MSHAGHHPVGIHIVEAFTDDRGLSFAIPGEIMREYGTSHAVFNRPGCVRGNHVHPNADEVLFVQGPALIRWRTGEGERGERVVEGTGVIQCSFPAGVAHAVRNEGLEPALLVSLQRSTDGLEIETVPEVILD